MRHNVGDRFTRILARAGLQKIVAGFDGVVPFLNIGAGLKNHFHLVGGFEHGRAAKIISRINGFTYVHTDFDYFTGELKVVEESVSRIPTIENLS